MATDSELTVWLAVHVPLLFRVQVAIGLAPSRKLTVPPAAAAEKPLTFSVTLAP